MNCPKCGTDEIKYVSEGKHTRMEGGHVAHAVLHGKEQPVLAVFAATFAAVGWVREALRHNWKCQKCNHTWHASSTAYVRGLGHSFGANDPDDKVCKYCGSSKGMATSEKIFCGGLRSR